MLSCTHLTWPLQAYERAWRHLAVSAGLPAASVLDVRGNHDAFDTIRGSDKVGVRARGIMGGGGNMNIAMCASVEEGLLRDLR